LLEICLQGAATGRQRSGVSCVWCDGWYSCQPSSAEYRRVQPPRSAQTTSTGFGRFRVQAAGAAFAAVHDAAVLGQHPQVGVEQARVRVPVVVALDLGLELRPAVAVAHQEVDARHVAFERVIGVEAWNSSLKARFVDRSPSFERWSML
jgi:hypothetical protein